MRSLWVRLLFSHVLVAFIAGITAYLLVPYLTPVLFDDAPPGVPAGTNRPQMREAVRQSQLIGVAIGTGAGVAFGAFATYRLRRSLGAVRRATRQIASGRYDVRVAQPNESELSALAADVNTMATALGDVETRRVQLMGEVAHELRTPLTILTGEVEGMLDGVLPTDRARLTSLAEELQRLARLADGLSELSKAEAGHMSLRPVHTDLRGCVQKVTGALRPAADEAGVGLVAPDGEPIFAEVDPDRMCQVVGNLVTNAIRATPAGGEVRVTVVDGDPVTLTVADTGEGISAIDLPRIFERFYRPPERRDGEGSGIGLTIARQLVRAHGGDLVAASPGKGRGATFTATIPR